MRQSVIFFFSMIFSFCSFAQYSVKHYSASDGLAHDVTYHIYQDSKGYIWVGTDDGLSRYDGRTFKNYGTQNGLINNYVMDIEEISNNTYAVSTWGGGIYFLKNDTLIKNKNFEDTTIKMANMMVSDSIIYTNSSSKSLIYNLKKDTLLEYWYTPRNGFKPFNGEVNYDLTKISKTGNIIFLHDREKYQYDHKGVLRVSNNLCTTVVFPYLKDEVIGTVTALDSTRYVFGSGNTLLMGTLDSLTTKVPINLIPKTDRITKVLKSPKDDDTFFLIARNESGFKNLFTFNKGSGQAKNMIKELNINTTISDAIFDFEGNLWISTFGDGVYCYYYNNPEIKNILTGNYIVDIVQQEERVYALSPSKLFTFKNTILSSTHDIKGFAKKILITKDTLYISVLDGDTEKSFENIKIVEGQFYGISKYGTVRQSHTTFLNEKPVHDIDEMVINAMEDTKNGINFYTTKGMWVYDNASSQLVMDTLFKLPGNADRIHGMVKKPDSVFYITQKGLYIENENLIKKIGIAEGLLNESINDIHVDKPILLATQNGLSIIEKNEVLNYSKSVGFGSLAINSILRLKDELWLGGDNGITIIKEESLVKSPTPRINVSQNGPRFDFNAISFENTELWSAYCLNNGGWISISPSNTKLDFSEYAHDNYTVQFKSRKSNSEWTYSKLYTFTITQPWYKKWWALIFFFTLTTGTLLFLFYNRLKIISKRNEALKQEMEKRRVAEKELGQVRATIARDFHDDLGNKLASISLLSDVLLQKVNTTEIKVLQTIKDDADYLYKGTKDFIFSLQDKSNYLDELTIYLADFAEDYLHQFGIGFEVDTDIKPQIKLPYYWSKQIIYIFKEFFTNTAKHADAKQVRLFFELEGPLLSITAIDDGKGFETHKTKPSGLKNMVARAKKIDCNVTCLSKPGMGTKIIFSGKLPQ